MQLFAMQSTKSSTTQQREQDNMDRQTLTTFCMECMVSNGAMERS